MTFGPPNTGVKVPIIGKTSGLNTVLDPFQTQETDALAKSVNVRITDSGVIDRFDPTTYLFNLTNGHSLFCDGGACVIHGGTVLYELNADLSLSGSKRTGMSGNPLSQTQAGDAIYFSNTTENGLYFQNTAISWAVDPYVGPETNRYFITDVPFFSKIAYFNGYILGFIENALYASELGLLGLFEMKPVWMSNSDGIMIKPVSDGVFISDRNKQYFLRGLEPKAFKEEPVAGYPALEWSVETELLQVSRFAEIAANVSVSDGFCAKWASTEGVCLGFDNGKFLNVTEERINIPPVFIAGAGITNGHFSISTFR
jgi:hypothetical protein